METQSKQWGGKREGAGRPKTMEKRVNFCASKEVADILSTIDKKSEFICAAIMAYAKAKK